MWLAGNGWQAIARAMRCRPETCRRWPIQYPELWAHVTQKVQEEQWREMCATCDRSLRAMMRGDDAKYRRKAAKLILEGARRNSPVVSAEALEEAILVLAAESAEREPVARASDRT
jgi:hypothetical protein